MFPLCQKWIIYVINKLLFWPPHTWLLSVEKQTFQWCLLLASCPPLWIPLPWPNGAVSMRTGRSVCGTGMEHQWENCWNVLAEWWMIYWLCMLKASAKVAGTTNISPMLQTSKQNAITTRTVIAFCRFCPLEMFLKKLVVERANFHYWVFSSPKIFSYSTQN